jgi:hypothetical protein
MLPLLGCNSNFKFDSQVTKDVKLCREQFPRRILLRSRKQPARRDREKYTFQAVARASILVIFIIDAPSKKNYNITVYLRFIA